ncbi:MAG: hypothetical protein DCC67_18470 [Planctomycetota bacterium]|nr:MAG: hypothetical protein DCC67_18470 [Planctomycetota bacterium]
MLMTTTPHVEGRPVREYLGVVTGEAVLGANVFKDFFAGIRDIVGVDLGYETVGPQSSMLMVSIGGAAVIV